MQILLGVLALVTAVVAGACSSWSPCGRSMLSTLTPLARRGRGQSYPATAAWFIAGSLSGGACTGSLLGGLATLTSSLSPKLTVAGAAAAAIVAAASDARLGGVALPFHRRQVNERWLDRFRPWVFGSGFGWQIGTGFATYITTAGLYLMAVLAVLSGNPLSAAGAGLTFGAVRGLAVLAGRSITDTAGLVAFHRRFDAIEASVRRTMIGWEAASAIAALGAWTALVFAPADGVVAATLAVLVVSGYGIVRWRRSVVSSTSMRGDGPRTVRFADAPGTVSARRGHR